MTLKNKIIIFYLQILKKQRFQFKEHINSKPYTKIIEISKKKQQLRNILFCFKIPIYNVRDITPTSKKLKSYIIYLFAYFDNQKLMYLRMLSQTDRQTVREVKLCKIKASDCIKLILYCYFSFYGDSKRCSFLSQ